MTTHEEHDQKLMEAFVEVLHAEERLRAYKTQLSEVEAEVKPMINRTQAEIEKAWQAVQEIMAESGEYEALLPGTGNDYKIAFSKGVEVVVGDAEAAPDEWVKVERSLKKKELLPHLKELRDAGQPLPNWARIERSESKIGYRLVKKGGE
jgi:prefoldin subunit 5